MLVSGSSHFVIFRHLARSDREGCRGLHGVYSIAWGVCRDHLSPPARYYNSRGHSKLKGLLSRRPI